MTSYEPLTIEYRGNLPDNIHTGYICVVDENSRVICHTGNTEELVFYRSAAKPIQALDAIAMGLDKKYNITDEESVLFASSHAAEQFHVESLTSILEKADLYEDLLIMPPTSQTNNAANQERIRRGQPPRKIYHNCSGMHISLMLIQRELGGDIREYWRTDAKVNGVSLKTVSKLSELNECKTGIDGCGVPVFAAGMKNIAAAFKNLACIDTIKDDKLADAAARFIPLFNKYPRMIRGTGFICSLINTDPNIIAKGGAAGVYGIGLKKERIGISIKLADGTENTWPIIISEIFRQIGYNNLYTMEILRKLHDGIIYNDLKYPIGHCETVFKLTC